MTTKEELAEFFMEYAITMPDSTDRDNYWVEEKVLCVREEHWLTFVSPDTIQFILDNNVASEIFWGWYNQEAVLSDDNDLPKYFEKRKDKIVVQHNTIDKPKPTDIDKI